MSYDEFGTARRPLRIAVLVKQVPQFEDMAFGPTAPAARRHRARDESLLPPSGGQGDRARPVERRACTVLTLGPPSAEDCLREAVAWGADDGVLITDPAFAGSDTLATARTLAAALGREGPFDLILMGRNSVDSDTGQVAPSSPRCSGSRFSSGPSPSRPTVIGCVLVRAGRRLARRRGAASRGGQLRGAPLRPVQGRPGRTRCGRPGSAADDQRGDARRGALGRGRKPDERR